MAHAFYAPSASHRWLVCTAAPHAEAGQPEQETSDAAVKGTLYHEVAASALRRLVTPTAAAQFVTDLEVRRALKYAYAAVYRNGDEAGEIPAGSAHSLMNKDEAYEAVFPYLRHILDTCGKDIAAGAPFGIEDKVRMDSALGGDCTGTVDFWCMGRRGLVVVDLKTGRFPVSPVENPQLTLYTIGVLVGLTSRTLDPTVMGNPVSLVIHQGGKAKVWETDREYLEDSLYLFREAITVAESGHGRFEPGGHCKFCNARHTCAAFAQHGAELARSEFGELPVPAETALTRMEADEATRLLNNLDRVALFADTAREVLRDRVYRGELKLPGFKVIRGTKRKTWQDKDKAEKTLRGRYGRKAFKAQLLTPTQAIREFGEQALAGLWEQPIGELRLVSEDTRGKAVTAAPADDFADAITTGDSE